MIVHQPGRPGAQPAAYQQGTRQPAGWACGNRITWIIMTVVFKLIGIILFVLALSETEEFGYFFLEIIAGIVFLSFGGAFACGICPVACFARHEYHHETVVVGGLSLIHISEPTRPY
eukprot:TRINITY_DN11490_c0_g1_i1.p2 TRINITY_DN11490_c0_g1~~TRINITY_DN11490_c0_g1_i1.p2  ORF type:complete len:117 (-),score=14.09 TRINITY_DN11490_c0_g1_i1:75-425(-)